jgi:hypothetical protein
MHYEIHDSSGTPLLLLHGGLRHPPAVRRTATPETHRTTDRPANHPGGRLKLAHPQGLTISLGMVGDSPAAAIFMTECAVALREAVCRTPGVQRNTAKSYVSKRLEPTITQWTGLHT